MADQKCPVCGMDATNSNITATYKGKQYKFCCPECKKQFEKNPEKYI